MVEGATESLKLQLAVPRILLYMGSAPRTDPRFSRSVKEACARARVAASRDNTDVDKNTIVVLSSKESTHEIIASAQDNQVVRWCTPEPPSWK